MINTLQRAAEQETAIRCQELREEVSRSMLVAEARISERLGKHLIDVEVSRARQSLAGGVEGGPADHVNPPDPEAGARQREALAGILAAVEQAKRPSAEMQEEMLAEILAQLQE